MSNPTIDYDSLKLEFFESEFVDLSPFLEEKFGRTLGEFGGNQQKKLTGWAEDKKKWKKSLLDKAKKKAEEQLTDAWSKTLQNVDTARRNGLNVIAQVLGDKKILEKIKTPKDCAQLVPILRQLKHESGEGDEDDGTITSFNLKITRAENPSNKKK